jgi:hypothetical protein
MFLQDWGNAQGGTVTLEFPLSLGYNNWDATIADMIDIR